jgi:hypothetical protein
VQQAEPKPSDEDIWRDFFEGRRILTDLRGLKTENKRRPDFQDTTSGVPLWLNSAPQWVTSKLAEVDAGLDSGNSKVCASIE